MIKNSQVAQIFTQCQPLLNKVERVHNMKKSNFICGCLDLIDRTNNQESACAAKTLIRNSIGKHQTLPKQFESILNDKSKVHTDEEFQTWRHKWLMVAIEELNKEPDEIFNVDNFDHIGPTAYAKVFQ